MVLRDAQPGDFTAVLALNQAALPAVSPLTQASLESLAASAVAFKVMAEPEGGVGAFILALPVGIAYSSLNYQWFTARYPSFVYIDRVVVAPSHGRLGLGRKLYAAVAALAAQQQTVVTCEVNVRPRNDVSLAFHAAMGFDIVGEQDTDGGAKRVALMMKSSAPNRHPIV